MKKTIIVNISMFTFKQDVRIYEGNQVIDYATCSMKDLPNTVVAYAKKHDVNEIKMKGTKAFCQKYGQKIQEYELKYYNSSNINIDYI